MGQGGAAAEEVEGLINGLKVEVYVGEWQSLPDFDTQTPVSKGRAEKFTHSVDPKLSDKFGLRFTGYIDIKTEGRYTFSTISDDGSRLYIGDELVADNDGLHGAEEKGGKIRLAPGKHPITVTYFESTGGEVLQVFYEGPGVAKQEIPADVLYSGQ